MIFTKVKDFIFNRSNSDAKVAPRTGAMSWSRLFSPSQVDNAVPIGGAESALSVAAAYLCVKKISEAVAVLPLHVQRQSGGIFVDDNDPAFGQRLSYLLNVQPDAGVSGFEFKSRLVQALLLEGNAYVVPLYAGETITRLVLCGRGTVSHDPQRGIIDIDDPVNRLRGRFYEDDVLHVKNYATGDGLGISVLSFARQCISTAATGDRQTLKRFANGGDVGGFVTNDRAGVQGFGSYADEELEKAADTIDDRLRAGERIIPLPGDSRFEQLTMTSADMQFLESRRFAAEDICRFFSVHPSLVYLASSSNYKDSENVYTDFLQFTLNPILMRIETELLRKLVSPSLATKRRFRFDRGELTACDLRSRAEYQEKTIAAGLYTVNEWRAIENRPPVEGGDLGLVSANLRTLQELNAPRQPDGSTEPINPTEPEKTEQEPESEPKE